MALQVIGTGLGRTGTKSMHSALNILGFGPCHHMVEMFAHPETIPAWIAAGKGAKNWDQLFEGYRAVVDWPGVQHWRELVAYYPDAKIIHTTRDVEAWFESTQLTIFNAANQSRIIGSPFEEFFNYAVADVRAHLNDRAFLIDYFRRHEAEVMATIPAERMLIYPVGSGWEPLCEFLGVPVPDEPYPRENSRRDFADRAEAVIEGVLNSPYVPQS
jgi:hypothetical protein